MTKKLVPPDFTMRSVTKDAIEVLSAPVGRIITAWSFVDQNIDIWTLEAFRLDEGRAAIPRNFDDKLDYLKKLHKRHNISVEATEVAREIFSRVKVVARVRHALAHWTLTHFSEDYGGTAVFTKITLHEDGSVTTKDVVYTLQELRDHLDEIIALAGTLQALTKSLADAR